MTCPTGAESDLAELIGRARPHRLDRAIPDEVRPWLLPFDWDRDRLWSIQTPVREVAIADLRWHYDLPWWTSGDEPVPLPRTTADAPPVAGAWFKVRPADVIAAPARYRRHTAKVDAVELEFPLHGLWRRDRWLILDGIHRLVCADRAGHTSVQVVTLSIQRRRDDRRCVNLRR